MFILMNIWMNGESLMKHNCPKKEYFFRYLNLEDITGSDYNHAKRVCKEFEIKKLGEYNDLYLKSNTLLLTDIFENFRKMCLEIYELDQQNFLQPQDYLYKLVKKKTRVE